MARVGSMKLASFQPWVVEYSLVDPVKLTPLTIARCNFMTNHYGRKSPQNGGQLGWACPHGYTGDSVGIHGFTLTLLSISDTERITMEAI